jgi:hypothetical protein
MEEFMKRVITAVAIFLIISAGTALALSPVGQWNFTSYPANHNPAPTQGICFLNNGTWYSTTFIGWNGLWNQNPDGIGIKFYGTTGIISTADFGRFVSDTKISGQYAHFFTKPVATSSIGHFVATWTGPCVDPPAALVEPSAAALSDDSVEDGDPAIR